MEVCICVIIGNIYNLGMFSPRLSWNRFHIIVANCTQVSRDHLKT